MMVKGDSESRVCTTGCVRGQPTVAMSAKTLSTSKLKRKIKIPNDKNGKFSNCRTVSAYNIYILQGTLQNLMSQGK